LACKLDPTIRWSAKITQARQPYPTGSFLLLIAAVLPYILMLALIWDGPS